MKVLSLDGGGINGIMAANILQKLRLGSENFDLIVGTSTGGIIALALRYGLGADDLVTFYRDKGPGIFPSYWRRAIRGRLLGGLIRTRYSSDPLKKAVLEAIPGADGKLLNEFPGKVLVTAYDLEHRQFRAFRSWKDSVSVLDAAMATSAAPVYFPAWKNWIDGGVVVNNPSNVAIAAAISLGAKLEDISLLSIGSGWKRQPVGAFARDMGAVTMGIRFPEITLSGSSQVEDYISRQLVSRYMRINPEHIESSGAMDDPSQENIKALILDSDRAVTQLVESVSESMFSGPD